MTLENQSTVIKVAYDEACLYPYTTPEMFKTASLSNIDTDEVFKSAVIEKFSLSVASEEAPLIDGQQGMPKYDIVFNNSAIVGLRDRIAIIGIGSNCSPMVLRKKFHSAGVQGKFFIAQGTLEDHAIVHGAFVGAKGNIPATIIPHQGTQAQVTIGFYTAEQALALTGTEPNYDLVHMRTHINVRYGINSEPLGRGALVYVSIWGALTEDGVSPILQAGIPQKSDLVPGTTAFAIEKAAQITGYGDNSERFVSSIKPGNENLVERLRHTFQLQAKNAIPARISGIQLKKAGLYKDVSNLAVRFQLPKIKYI